ncbi:ParA family protein [Aminivibrio sp.]|jgi:chromosome partitioning protein|uniref:ParA family protein n=1 Tax=Aminivibrio sp. TaxID=1872489 RepID=UPI001A3E5FDD|nr:ParA family protein [Aminivibrio sp.]MBL3540500.1 ParA family protein [Aminivibrio sp.]MDK2958401.1 chromosome partitioning protein [Synergistaceae bacterium]
MRIVGFCNLKGGVGKTTACQNLAVALARRGLRVAALDLDPQSNLTAGFGISVPEDHPYIYDFLLGDTSFEEVKVSREGVDVVPSTLDLAMAEMQIESQPGRDTLLRDALESADLSGYDCVFCDSPPQLGIFTRNVLAASHEVIVPLESEFFSLAGLRLLSRTVELFRRRLNKGLAIGGVLLTRHNPKIIMNREVEKEVRSHFGDIVFSRYIRRNISLVEAGGAGVSVFGYDPESNGALDYSVVADELLERWKNNG